MCVAVHRILVRQQDGSDLVAAEAMQWRAAVVLGVAVAIGFTVDDTQKDQITGTRKIPRTANRATNGTPSFQ